MNNKHWKDWTPEDWQNAEYCEQCNLPLIKIEDDPEMGGICVYCMWTDQHQTSHIFLLQALAFYAAPGNYVKIKTADGGDMQGTSQIELDNGKKAQEATAYFNQMLEDTYTKRLEQSADEIEEGEMISEPIDAGSAAIGKVGDGSINEVNKPADHQKKKRRKLGSRQQKVLEMIPNEWTPLHIIVLTKPLYSYSKIMGIMERLKDLGYIESNDANEYRRIKDE